MGEWRDRSLLLLSGGCLVQPTPSPVFLALDVLPILTYHPFQPASRAMSLPLCLVSSLTQGWHPGLLKPEESPVFLRERPSAGTSCLFLQIRVKQEEMWVSSFGRHPSHLLVPRSQSLHLLPHSSTLQGRPGSPKPRTCRHPCSGSESFRRVLMSLENPKRF